MNDRLKFRVFNLETKVMIDNPDFLSFDYDCDFVRVRDAKLSINEIFNLKYDKIIIDQCTGLKDKNGKLIFENDVVDIEYHGKSKVFWNGGWRVNGKMSVISFGKSNAKICKIIGNIHQDSHLFIRG